MLFYERAGRCYWVTEITIQIILSHYLLTFNIKKDLINYLFYYVYAHSVDVGKSPDIPYVYVSNEGLVQNYKPIQVVTACSLNIYNFPFDVQKCSLTFQSWLHTSKSYYPVWHPNNKPTLVSAVSLEKLFSMVN